MHFPFPFENKVELLGTNSTAFDSRKSAYLADKQNPKKLLSR